MSALGKVVNAKYAEWKKTGDPQVFDELYLHSLALAKAVAFRKLTPCDPFTAEEIAEDWTCKELFEDPRFEGRKGCKFASFLHDCIVDACIDFFRKRVERKDQLIAPEDAAVIQGTDPAGAEHNPHEGFLGSPTPEYGYNLVPPNLDARERDLCAWVIAGGRIADWQEAHKLSTRHVLRIRGDISKKSAAYYDQLSKGRSKRVTVSPTENCGVAECTHCHGTGFEAVISVSRIYDLKSIYARRQHREEPHLAEPHAPDSWSLAPCRCTYSRVAVPAIKQIPADEYDREFAKQSEDWGRVWCSKAYVDKDPRTCIGRDVEETDRAEPHYAIAAD